MTVAITAVHAREILDSRGNPTIEVDVELGMGRSAELPFPVAPAPELTRLVNSATVTKIGSSGRGSARPLKTSTNTSQMPLST